MRYVSRRTVMGSVLATALPVVLAAGQAASGPARLNGAWVLNRQQSSSVGGGDSVPEDVVGIMVASAAASGQAA